MNVFSCHHVGGRGGSRGFPFIKSVNKSIVSVMYDADTDAVNQMIINTNNLSNRTYCLPYAVGEVSGIVNFYSTVDPNMSSLLMPIQNKNLSFPYPQMPFDYLMNEAGRVREVRKVELQSLDEILRENPGIPKPVFLSIDTQGSELSILKGAKETLKTVAAVMVEVEFDELYEGQPLFGEIHEFLTISGFILMDIEKGIPTTPFRAPVGGRAKGQLTWGDALYFKKPNNTEKSALAFCALAFGYSEYALSCFPLGEVIYPEIHDLLNEFHKEVKSLPSTLPPTYAEFYTQPKFKNNSETSPNLNQVDLFKSLRDFKKYFLFFLNLLRIKQSVRKILYFITSVYSHYQIRTVSKFAKKHGLALLEKELHLSRKIRHEKLKRNEFIY